MQKKPLSNYKNLKDDKLSLFLFILICVLWSFTWIAGKYQVNSGVGFEFLISYRFMAVALLMFIIIKVLRKSLKIKASEFKVLFIYSILGGSVHLILFYYAAFYMITSISAIIFSFSIILVGLMKHFFKISSEKLSIVMISGGIGIVGLILILSQKFTSGAEKSLWMGLLMASLGTLCYSAGSTFYDANKWKVSLDPLSSFFYVATLGSMVAFILGLIVTFAFDRPLIFVPNFSLSFVLSYIYLVFSGCGLLCFMMLITRIGAVKASYPNLITPVMAILVSSVFEDYKILLSTIIGIVLVLISNYIALFRKNPIKKPTA